MENKSYNTKQLVSLLEETFKTHGEKGLRKYGYSLADLNALRNIK